ncbi:hypothetical protein ACF0H5_017017 [Mactra antiquata]
MLKIVLLLLIPFICDGFLFHNSPEWNGLKVSWSPNPFSGFHDLPRQRLEAVNDGWELLVPNSGCDGHANFKGERYIKNHDYGVILIYDASGYIAGIQIGFPSSYSPNPNRYPPETLVNSPLVLDNGVYYLTAYFVHPGTICTGRSQDEFEETGTGEGLWIQNGTNPVLDSISIPKQESDIVNTRWTRGKCFYTMGMHYWYNIRSNMTCDEFFPVFLMYNDGLLNSFGWALGMNIETSEFLEHPPPTSYGRFLKPVPRCLKSQGILTTLHIYMTDSVFWNHC